MRHSLRYDRDEFGAKVGALLSSLRIHSDNIDLYMLACVHRSVLNEAHTGYTESNERLEYLGDAILELVVTEALFHAFPEKPEGELTDIRSALVRGRNLAEIAAKLDFSGVIQFSRGESLAWGQDNPYILANTLEAMLGAIYLDQGMEKAREFILTHIYSTLDHILEKGLYVDPKSYLQEYTQAIWGITPTYSVAREDWADHDKVYIISATLGGTLLWEGKGTSKKKWEQDAAENALSRKKEWEGNVGLPRKTL